MDEKITHDEYKKCLFEGGKQWRITNKICSNKHEIFTEEVNKKALSRKDDKRKIMDDGIHTKTYGHYSLNVIS